MSREQIIGALNGFMLVLLTSWAFFQYNDPDGPLWIAIYGLAVAGIILFEYDRIAPRILWLYSGLMFLWGAYWAVQLDTPMLVEEGREMVGSWIVAGWVGYLATRALRRE